ncbi:hypothetical protein Atai01_63240 [Amycolatopsis taiwanensis]|uniref:Uncharacterized protein n=1 Tax=Amycolatopsis taiwanensis TaxID=342230 RepID=A0A9W6R7I6_9PSEU|nr:hypothetical protein Atai01_63240 [Amycolatopsis taiwanensis]
MVQSALAIMDDDSGSSTIRPSRQRLQILHPAQTSRDDDVDGHREAHRPGRVSGRLQALHEAETWWRRQEDWLMRDDVLVMHRQL